MLSAWFQKYTSPILPAFLLCLLVSLCGCGVKERWYKPHHFQADFDKDTLVCETTAHELARQATMLGKGEDQVVFVTAFNNCLYRKGWSNVPPAAMNEQGRQGGGGVLALLDGGKVQGFGKTIQMPHGFTLVSEASQVSGPLRAQNFQWVGGDSTFIHIIYQKTTAQSFDPIDYAVVEPFSLYARGRDEKEPDFLRWAVFVGEMKKNWVVGLGSYVLVNKEERIIVVVTRPLPTPEPPPPPGMRLSKEQRDVTERFMVEWLDWLKGAMPMM